MENKFKYYLVDDSFNDIHLLPLTTTNLINETGLSGVKLNDHFNKDDLARINAQAVRGAARAGAFSYLAQYFSNYAYRKTVEKILKVDVQQKLITVMPKNGGVLIELRYMTPKVVGELNDHSLILNNAFIASYCFNQSHTRITPYHLAIGNGDVSSDLNNTQKQNLMRKLVKQVYSRVIFSESQFGRVQPTPPNNYSWHSLYLWAVKDDS